MRSRIEVALIVAALVVIALSCSWAWDNDPSFQLSPTYDGHHSYMSE